jgi:hypothetical protein
MILEEFKACADPLRTAAGDHDGSNGWKGDESSEQPTSHRQRALDALIEAYSPGTVYAVYAGLCWSMRWQGFLRNVTIGPALQAQSEHSNTLMIIRFC